MENPEESVIFETSKHLNGLNTYNRNSVQRTNLATPTYEQTLPIIVYPAPVVYDEKHVNNLYGDIPYEP